MLRDYQEALDAYERTKRLDRFEQILDEVGRGHDALDRLELQWLGRIDPGRAQREEAGPRAFPPGCHESPTATRARGRTCSSTPAVLRWPG
ncbi:hypothetical protein ACQEU3_16090 [Spirillospora sp. CA-253888]